MTSNTPDLKYVHMIYFQFFKKSDLKLHVKCESVIIAIVI